MIEDEERIIEGLESDMQQLDTRIEEIQADVRRVDELGLENEEVSVRF